MKTMTAREAKNAFGVFLDTAQREPVVVTKKDRPVGVMFSLNDFPAMVEFVDTMKQKINAGIRTGLEQAEVGQGRELNDDLVAELKQRLQARIANQPKA